MVFNFFSKKKKKKNIFLMRGIFVVFEGLDKSGKSTQVNILYNTLKNKNINVEKISFPGIFLAKNI